jgi:hypothetical protein
MKTKLTTLGLSLLVAGMAVAQPADSLLKFDYPNASHGLQNALLQSVPPSAEKEPVNTVFPAWPKGWDAQFKLAARGAFLISASRQNDQTEFVEIFSEKGGQCLLQNPWPDGVVTVYRNSRVAEDVSGKLLTLSTAAGEDLTLAHKGQVPVAKTLR